ncbi:hypothetical protein BD779DRAFT_1545128, partial [Infundibulicybe gibba]
MHLVVGLECRKVLRRPGPAETLDSYRVYMPHGARQMWICIAYDELLRFVLRRARIIGSSLPSIFVLD